MSGVLLHEGLDVIIPEGGFFLRLDESGMPVEGGLTLHLSFDVVPTWLRLGSSHAAQALQAREARSDTPKIEEMEVEFAASMQAIVSCAVALDALYARVRPQRKVLQHPKKAKVGRRTARYIVVSEAFRQAFRLDKGASAKVREFLKVVFTLRDIAVHPSPEQRPSRLHPEYGVEVEWHFAQFTGVHARDAIQNTTLLLLRFARAARERSLPATGYMARIERHISLLYPNGHPLEPAST